MINLHKFLPRAFTLVEIMIVMAIIGILAASLYPSLGGYISRARDAQRLSDMHTISSSIQLYSVDYEVYPPSEGTWCYPYTILPGKFLSRVALSPKGVTYNEGCGENGYYGYGVWASGATNSNDYILTAYMENLPLGNYSGSFIGMTWTLSPYGSWNAKYNTIKWSWNYYIYFNSWLSTNSTGTVAPVAISPVDGWWSMWTAWDTCTVSCGWWTQSQSRYCNNPAPLNGWAYCIWSATATQACNTTACPVLVTFDANGWTWHTPTTKNIVPWSTVWTLPTNPTRTGYTFNWWYTATTGWTLITTATTITSAVTFYAQWILTANWEVWAWWACSAAPTWTAWSWYSACSASTCGIWWTQTQTRSCVNTSGSQNRTVLCRMGDGSIGADSVCTSMVWPKPSTSIACSSTCSWASTDTISCTSNCYGRWRRSTGWYTSCNNLGLTAIRCYNWIDCIGGECGYRYNGENTIWRPGWIPETITCEVYRNSSCTTPR